MKSNAAVTSTALIANLSPKRILNKESYSNAQGISSFTALLHDYASLSTL